jgi:2'-5' RNA ligase
VLSAQPFIDDPGHLRALERQRFVVLRPLPPVTAIYGELQAALRRELAALPVSYPAHAHVTLCGFAAGALLGAVQDLARSWAPSVQPQVIEVERVSSFPPPFQVVIIHVRKTPRLSAALADLRRRAEALQLPVSTLVPVGQWIFHMSVAYCSELSIPDWHELTSSVETLRVLPAHCTVEEAEVVAFDEGREYSGGTYSFRAQQAFRMTTVKGDK